MLSYLPFRMAELSSSKLIVFGLVPLLQHITLLLWGFTVLWDSSFYVRLAQEQPHTQPPSVSSWHPGAPLQVWAQCPPSELLSNTWPSHSKNSLPSLLRFVLGLLLPWMYFHLICYQVLFSGSIISLVENRHFILGPWVTPAGPSSFPYKEKGHQQGFFLFFGYTGVQINVMN